MSINISGAVDFRVIDYNNRRFILFSDIHSGFEGLCQESCLTSSDNVDGNDSICYTVDGAIKKIILEANKRDEYVDIFLESNFYGAPPHRVLLPNATDPLDLTTRAYRNCLYDRSTCPYKNARFHYIDIRQGISKGTTFLGVVPNMMDFVRKINKSALWTPLSNKTPGTLLGGTINDYLTFYVTSYIVRLFVSSDILTNSHLWLFIKILLESDNYTADVTEFLNKILIINNKMSDRFTLALSKIFPKTSLDRIRSALNKLLQDKLNQVRAMSIEPTMIVQRNGLIMSRIRAQLIGLINQGDRNISESLQQYIYDKIQAVSIVNLYKLLRLQYKHLLEYVESVSIIPRNQAIVEDHISFLRRKLPENPLLHITSFVMDLYTIARMLRTFPNQYIKTGKHPQHIISSYVIAHEGKAHINTITDYLQYIGAVPIIYSPASTNSRCINISKSNLFK